MPEAEDRAALSRFARDVLRYAPARIVPALTAAVGAYLFTRQLAPAEYGAYTLLLALVWPVALALTEWAAQPAGRFLSEYRERGRGDVYGALLRRLAAWALAGALVAALALGLAARGAWGDAFAWSGALYLVALVGLGLLGPILLAALDSAFYSALVALLAIAQLGSAIVLMRVLGPDPAWLVLGQALPILVALPFVLRRARRHVRAPAHDVPPDDTRRFLRYGAPMMAWVLAAQLLNAGDLYVIQLFRGSEEVGVYAASYALAAGLGGLLGIPITMAAFPIVMDLWARGRREEVPRVLAAMTEGFALLALGLVGVVAVLAPDLVALLLGARFHAGYVVLVPVLVGQALWQVSMLGHKGLELRERTGTMLAWVFAAVALNFLLNLLLVPRYGFLAAAYATAASYALYAALVWLSSRDGPAWRVPWARVALFAGLALLAAACARLVPAAPGAPAILARGVVFGGIYAVGALVVERREIGAWLARRKRARAPAAPSTAEARE